METQTTETPVPGPGETEKDPPSSAAGEQTGPKSETPQPDGAGDSAKSNGKEKSPAATGESQQTVGEGGGGAGDGPGDGTKTESRPAPDGGPPDSPDGTREKEDPDPAPAGGGGGPQPPPFAQFANFGKISFAYDSKGEQGEERRPARTLFELTTTLPPPGARSTHFAAGEIADRCAALHSERLLFISCADVVIAKEAAHALVDALRLPPERARLLHFDRASADDSRHTFYALFENPQDCDGEVLVVVDALSLGARTFLDSLTNAQSLWADGVLTQTLRQNRAMMICLAEPQRCATRRHPGTEPPAAHWPVPFLEHLLRGPFPAGYRQAAETIAGQRAAGRWSRDDAELCRQLRDCIARGELAAVIEAGGLPPVAERDLPAEDDRPLHVAARYAGGFFPRLAPAEFDRLIIALLGDETVSVPIPPPPQPAGDGAVRPTEAWKEKRLAELWREGADRVLKECRLVVARDAASGPGIAFAEPGLGERVRGWFEGESPFYLHARFRAVHHARLLFDPSDALAARVVRMTVEMAEAYPDSYGRDWVLGLLDGERATAHNFNRSADLLRGMCEHAALVSTVHAVLEQLLSTGSQRATLELVTRLRFAPGFDVFPWLQRLVDGRDEAVRDSAYRFLYDELTGMGLQVYPTLQGVARWLPHRELDPDEYRPSHRLSLQLLMEYAWDTVLTFDAADFGRWPSRYPLLAVTDPAAAEEAAALLAGWLLHPGMLSVVKSDEIRVAAHLHYLVAALLAHWMYILYGPAAAPAEPSSPAAASGDVAAPADRRDALLDALLRAVVAATPGRDGREAR
ncbi:MAG TPA: hypothetical protein VF771_19365, partial [Longimicrobiaceae bacterium]